MDSVNGKTGNPYLDSMKWQKEPVKVADGNENRLQQEDFLKLLTEELAQQDPTKPVDNDQMISQMASFSQIEGIEQMNKQFESMNSVLTSSQALQASSLVGQKVLIPTSSGHVNEGEGMSGVVSLPQNVPSIKFQVEDENGQLIDTFDMGAQDGGNVQWEWDGTDITGQPVEAGNYTIKATSLVDGQNQEMAVSSYAHVSSVNLGTGSAGVILNLQGLGNISLNDVLAVAESN